MAVTTVGAIITNEEKFDQKILLTQRNIEPFKGKWCLPGGFIDSFEPAVTAIIREVKEEIDLDFKPQFLNYFDEIIPEKKNHAVVIVFYEKAHGNITIQESEVAEFASFSREEINSLEMAFKHSEILNYYFLNKRREMIY